MKILVVKFGGTSVGSLERIQNAAKRVLQKLKEGYRVVVVSSAMAGETDRLINLAKQIDPLPPERELDMLISTGEQQAIALFAMTLQTSWPPCHKNFSCLCPPQRPWLSCHPLPPLGPLSLGQPFSLSLLPLRHLPCLP